MSEKPLTLLRNGSVHHQSCTVTRSWRHRLETIERALVALIAPDDVFILVDDDQFRDELLIAHRAIPFLERGGRYWGAPPDDETAIREFRRLQEGGARLIAFAQPAFWWFEQYRGFQEYLSDNFRCVLKDPDLCVFDLRKTGESGKDGQRDSGLTRPNKAGDWERVYLTPISPVTELSSPVARAIAEFSEIDDLVLEAGCGSATASAELALAGRRVVLCDFSAPILQRARQVFEASGCAIPVAMECDITQPLPLPDDAVDVTWSSGVLEHWTDDELLPIVREMARISRKRVISLVPYAGCLLYRFGKYLGEANGAWPYGRELPRESLKAVFEAAGVAQTHEQIICHEAGPRVLGLSHRNWQSVAERWLTSLPEGDPVMKNQGYLLLTVGEIQPRCGGLRGSQ